jgi:hypothetical protein
VAGAAEARRLRRDKPDFAGIRVLGPPLLWECGPVRLCRAADVRAAARHEREARHRLEQAVVAHVGGQARDLARLPIGEEGGDYELALGERRDRTQVDGGMLAAEERREECEAGGGQGDGEGNEAAEGERRPLEQPAARVALVRLPV